MKRFTLPPMPEGFAPSPAPEGWLDGYVSHFSASGLRLLKVCPEAWRQRYLLGRKERPGEALVVGSAVHDAIAYSHRQKIETHTDLPVLEVVEFFNDLAWPKAVADDGGEEEIRWELKPGEVREQGARMTKSYHVAVSPRVQPVRVEERFEFVVPGVPVPFIGYIDVEEQGNNVDVKTGKAVQRKPDANWRTQGTIYSAYNGKPTHFHSVSRAKTPSIATPRESDEMAVYVDDRQRPYLEEMLRHYAAEVQWMFETLGPDQPWPTTGVLMDYKGGPACNFCGFRPTCVAWAHER